MIPTPAIWPQADGAPVSCREKLKMLAENHAELAQVLQDAFEDAVLMGVDEQAMRRSWPGMVEGLESPKCPAMRLKRRVPLVAVAVGSPRPPRCDTAPVLGAQPKSDVGPGAGAASAHAPHGVGAARGRGT